MTQETYRNRQLKFKEELKTKKALDIRFSIFRLSLIVVSFLCFYLYLSDYNQIIYFYWAILLLIGFIAALLRHQNIRKDIKRTKAYIEINRIEEVYLDGDVSVLDKGDEYRDPDHMYSHDLDVFGSNSLFQHINRTVTLSGKNKLAASLQGKHSVDQIEDRQEATKELNSNLEWRQKFRVAGFDIQENLSLMPAVKRWLDARSVKTWLSPFVLYPLAAVCFGLMLNWFINPSVQSFNWFSYSFMFNLLLTFSHFKAIKSEYGQLNGISKSLSVYGELLALVEEQSFESKHLNEVKSSLINAEYSAGKALKRLSRILDGFDQLNNVVALMLTNGLYHYHLHTLKNLYSWKKTYGGYLGEWLEVIASFDELNSLANYAYNHPDNCYPKVSEEPQFKAVELGHPLLNSKKRVDNNISFDDYDFMILTGSNMSGKSTFLKSLGLNLVLMKVGAPVCAREFFAFPFRLLSSMKLVDSIEKEESYFQAEVMRLKRIHEILQTEEKCFVLLDEILRGTNSDDKRSGTRLFLQKISSYNASGVIATHDVDIADLAEKGTAIYRAGYFESKVINGELVFDYTLRDGICRTPNATDLMKAQGII